MGIVITIVVLACAVWLLYALCFGFGAFVGILSLAARPSGKRKRAPEKRDDYYKRHTALSGYDARYQTREYKPPRGRNEI